MQEIVKLGEVKEIPVERVQTGGKWHLFLFYLP